MRLIKYLITLLIACLLTACSPGAMPVMPTHTAVKTPLPLNTLPAQATISPVVQVTDIPPQGTLPPLTEAEFAVSAARSFLAGILGVDEDMIKLVSQQEVEWRDGCLGLPEKDEMCTLALVPGYRIVLESGGMLYELRTSSSGMAVRMQPIGKETEPD